MRQNSSTVPNSDSVSDIEQKKMQPGNVSSVKKDPLPDDITPEVFSQRGLWSRPGFLVRRLNQIHYAMFFEECKEGNITPVQYGILTVLSRNPWLDQTAIGYELGLDRTTSADVIKRLEEKGLVERRVNPTDKRSRQANITPEGLSLMESLKDGMARSQQRLIEPLSPADRKTFMTLLTEVVEANNQHGRAALKSV